MTSAYPLAWPEGWPRTSFNRKIDGSTHFKKPSDSGWRKPYTFAQSRNALLEELGRMQATAIVLSTNYQLNSLGLPRGDRRRPDDEGVALYFTRNRKPLVIACDRYLRAEENMSSLRLALAAMRQLERHGGGVIAEKAFTGFTALPAPPSCWEILGLEPGASPEDIDRAWRAKAREAHPDRLGGSDAAMSAVNSARDAARKAAGQ